MSDNYIIDVHRNLMLGDERFLKTIQCPINKCFAKQRRIAIFQYSDLHKNSDVELDIDLPSFLRDTSHSATKIRRDKIVLELRSQRVLDTKSKASSAFRAIFVVAKKVGSNRDVIVVERCLTCATIIWMINNDVCISY